MPDCPRYCASCGLALSGLNDQGRCPGCGAAVAPLRDLDGVSPEAPIHVGPGPIAVDIPCLSCDYTLRGLTPAGVCPECGVPVSRSLQGAFLKFGGEDLLRRLTGGAFWVEMGLVARLLAGGAAIALSAAHRPLAAGVAMVLGVIALALSGWGWWLLTEPQPELLNRGPRRLARWAMVAGNLLELSVYTAWAGQSPSISRVASMYVPGGACVFTVGFSLLWLWSVAMQMLWLTEVARRIPDPPLATMTMTAAWLTPLLGAGSLPFAFACPVIAPAAWLAAFIFYFVVMDRARSGLARVRDDAVLHRRVEQAGVPAGESNYR